jgi:hypothetical protein
VGIIEKKYLAISYSSINLGGAIQCFRKPFFCITSFSLLLPSKLVFFENFIKKSSAFSCKYLMENKAINYTKFAN